MPDIELQAERRAYARDRQPIDDSQPPHKYKESEFPEGAGRCDLCGGGPDAEIHRPRIEPLERIAVALERLADLAEVEFEARLARTQMSFWEKLRAWWVLR